MTQRTGGVRVAAWFSPGSTGGGAPAEIVRRAVSSPVPASGTTARKTCDPLEASTAKDRPPPSEGAEPMSRPPSAIPPALVMISHLSPATGEPNPAMGVMLSSPSRVRVLLTVTKSLPALCASVGAPSSEEEYGGRVERQIGHDEMPGAVARGQGGAVLNGERPHAPGTAKRRASLHGDQPGGVVRAVDPQRAPGDRGEAAVGVVPGEHVVPSPVLVTPAVPLFSLIMTSTSGSTSWVPFCTLNVWVEPSRMPIPALAVTPRIWRGGGGSGGYRDGRVAGNWFANEPDATPPSSSVPPVMVTGMLPALW